MLVCTLIYTWLFSPSLSLSVYLHWFAIIHLLAYKIELLLFKKGYLKNLDLKNRIASLKLKCEQKNPLKNYNKSTSQHIFLNIVRLIEAD